VHNDLRAAFYEALGARQLVEIRRELVKTAEDNLATTQEMLNVGQANRSNLHLAKAHLQRSKLEQMMAENEYQQRWEQLVAFAGAEIGQRDLQGDLDGDLQFRDWEELLNDILAESPEIASARAKLEADRITVERERVQPIPNVTAQGAVGHNFELGRTVYMAQVSMPIPVFDRNQGTVQQARADLARQ
jgi:outer membrane protein TolC